MINAIYEFNDRDDKKYLKDETCKSFFNSPNFLAVPIHARERHRHVGFLGGDDQCNAFQRVSQMCSTGFKSGLLSGQSIF